MNVHSCGDKTHANANAANLEPVPNSTRKSQYFIYRFNEISVATCGYTICMRRSINWNHIGANLWTNPTPTCNLHEIPGHSILLLFFIIVFSFPFEFVCVFDIILVSSARSLLYWMFCSPKSRKGIGLNDSRVYIRHIDLSEMTSCGKRWAVCILASFRSDGLNNTLFGPVDHRGFDVCYIQTDR